MGPRRQPERRRAARAIEAPPPLTILDFGCGPGRDLETFRATRATSRSGSTGARASWRWRAPHTGCEVWHQDFLALDLPAARFDGVFANASLFHVPSEELPRVLRELWHALKPRGMLFASNPRGANHEGWQGGRYGVWHDLDSWRDLRHRRGLRRAVSLLPAAGPSAQRAAVARLRVAQGRRRRSRRVEHAPPLTAPGPLAYQRTCPLPDSSAAFHALLDTLRERRVDLRRSRRPRPARRHRGLPPPDPSARPTASTSTPRATPNGRASRRSPPRRSKILGDNVDSIYFFAPLRGDRGYRIRGVRGNGVYLAFCIYGGKPDGEWSERVVANVSQRDLRFAADGSFEIILSPAAPRDFAGTWVKLDPDAVCVITREYFDRAARRPAVTLSDRRAGTGAAAPPPHRRRRPRAPPARGRHLHPGDVQSSRSRPCPRTSSARRWRGAPTCRAGARPTTSTRSAPSASSPTRRW